VQLDPSTAELHQETGRRNDALRKIVVSDTETKTDTAPWTDTTTVVRRAEAHRAVRELRDQDGGDVLLFGSRTLWGDLLSAGLVDELHLLVAPVALPGGTPAFAAGDVPSLQLTDVRRREGSNNVLLSCAVSGRSSRRP